ncbi:hypothetical protein Scep_006928 [Stephania cephalantha]|uniref:Uncharacterized protein n=1 Tax=Stephania cephalantha TaxID=152367 RepID=A0AAP0K938_9MAGN
MAAVHDESTGELDVDNMVMARWLRLIGWLQAGVCAGPVEVKPIRSRRVPKKFVDVEEYEEVEVSSSGDNVAKADHIAHFVIKASIHHFVSSSGLSTSTLPDDENEAYSSTAHTINSGENATIDPNF